MKPSGQIHILHLTSGDLWAGAEVQLYHLVKAMMKQPDVKLSVILLNDGRLEQELRGLGVEVIVFDENRLGAVTILKNIIATVRQMRPDVVHTHRDKLNIFGSIASLLTPGSCSIRTVHGDDEFKPGWKQLPQKLIMLADRTCGRWLQHRVVAVTDELAGRLNSIYPTEHIHIIENGIDVEALSQLEKKQTDDDSGGQKTFHIGIAGRLVQIKRVDLFIETAARFTADHPDIRVRFHIYGDGPLLATLSSQVATADLTDIVHFQGHTDSIHEALSGLDALLMTSDHEGLPMVLLEAMALQLPIIAHSTGGITQLLDDGNCGMLVAEQNSADYAAALFRLCSDDDYRQQLIGNASERVANRYSSGQNAENYLALYHSLSDRR